MFSLSPAHEVALEAYGSTFAREVARLSIALGGEAVAADLDRAVEVIRSEACAALDNVLDRIRSGEEPEVAFADEASIAARWVVETLEDPR